MTLLSSYSTIVRLASISIRNYRCLAELEIRSADLTSLIGMNGSGKSAVLRAIAAFYDVGDPFTTDDWYAGKTEAEIEVTLTFEALSDAERGLFPRYVTPAGELRVSRVWRLVDDRLRDALYGYHFACPEFRAVREADRQVAALHNTLVDTGRYEGLQKVARQDDVEAALTAWEDSHPEQCEWIRDGGKFFGWRQVGNARLMSSTGCVYVPAVRDARQDAAQAKGSALSQVVELVLKAELQNNPALVQLREDTQGRFDEILEATRPTLRDLGRELSNLMVEFAPGSSVVLDWRPGAPALPEWPPIEARLSEEGVESPVWAKGHGLQRAFIVSLLQRLAEAQAQPLQEAQGAVQRHTVLLIEEPELYQHPLAARRFSRVLQQLTTGDRRVQVMYSTHHPEFVAFDHFDGIRRLQKEPGEGELPPATAVRFLTLRDVADRLIETWGLNPDDVTEASTRHRLRTVMTPHVSEGFFARGVVLVEGAQDEATIEGAARSRGLSFEDYGIAVIPVGGKSNLDRALMVFQGFGIPCYVVWDGDASKDKEAKAHAKQNAALMRLVGMEGAEFPPTTAGPSATVFSDELETELAEVLRDDYDELLQQASDVVALPIGREVLKTMYGCEAFFRLLAERDLSVPILEELVDRLVDRFAP